MRPYFIFILLFISIATLQAQERTLLRGQVLYRNGFVANENVVNVTAQKATITNDNGEFAIDVKIGDELVFSALQFRLKTVFITPEILRNNRLVVEVNEKITELSEVVVSPENVDKFVEVKEEEFKGFDYERDKATPVNNVAMDENILTYGVNFVNIYKALFKRKKETEPSVQLNMSEVIRELYEDDFFVVNLKIPQDEINKFLYYCDAQMPSNSLLKKDNEFQLIDFLVTQSNNYRSGK
ncbi:hypothetical protein ACFQ1M_10660 [Sungkyunkwania multivorans]|uniref:CarboxypepD_reg-like domain-containing protein n=1 Tax=Sungkyunkwania multivorans TaxID=1173618 RepID=A0ABW3D0R2_9FLAO